MITEIPSFWLTEGQDVHVQYWFYYLKDLRVVCPELGERVPGKESFLFI